MPKTFNKAEKPELEAASPEGDARLKRSEETTRQELAEDRTAVDQREMEDQSRFEASISDWDFDQMPKLPDIPGFRCIWLSTTHPQDTLPRRMRLGYTPVTMEDAPEYEHLVSREGEYASLLSINEMVAFKLPEELWQKYMTEFHHKRPNDEEDTIRELVEQMQAQANEAKGRIELESGMQDLMDEKMRQPKFN